MRRPLLAVLALLALLAVHSLAGAGNGDGCAWAAVAGAKAGPGAEAAAGSGTGGTGGAAKAPQAQPIAIGRALVPLDGPWRFHVGDDAGWASPGFDDSAWESVDLTPAPGAHDGDVGLTGYVPGWGSRGHPGYRGFAWYRLRMTLSTRPGETLAIAGPPVVDYAYQIFFDGRLLGGCGDFSGATPTLYSVQPRLFLLPALPAGGASGAKTSSAPDAGGVGGAGGAKTSSAPDAGGAGGAGGGATTTHVVAIRAWADPALGLPGDGGGVHIAPHLGEAGAVTAHYRLEWLETFDGYIVDAVEPVVLALLAVMAAAVLALDRADRTLPWLIAALLLTALVRCNQPVFFWGQFESLRTFAIVRRVLLEPLIAGAWTMTWRAWFRLPNPTWMALTARVTAAAVAVYLGAVVLSSWIFAPLLAAPARAGIGRVALAARLLLALVTLLIAAAGTADLREGRWPSLLALLLTSVAIFAPELSLIGVPGIWFPAGVGVSRTEYALAALAPVLFTLLLLRLRAFARPQPRGPATAGVA